MAVANTKATGVANADQQYPKVLNSPWLSKGAVFCAAGQLAVAASDSNGSVYRFARVPSGARIAQLDVFSDAITGFTSASIGVYKMQDQSANQGAAVNTSLFGSGIDLSVVQTEPYDVVFNNLGISNIEKRVWELLGLAADPFTFYDICITGVTMTSGTGNIAMRLKYTV